MLTRDLAPGDRFRFIEPRHNEIHEGWTFVGMDGIEAVATNPAVLGGEEINFDPDDTVEKEGTVTTPNNDPTWTRAAQSVIGALIKRARHEIGIDLSASAAVDWLENIQNAIGVDELLITLSDNDDFVIADAPPPVESSDDDEREVVPCNDCGRPCFYDYESKPEGWRHLESPERGCFLIAAEPRGGSRMDGPLVRDGKTPSEEA